MKGERRGGNRGRADCCGKDVKEKDPLLRMEEKA
jgi:hypothetical protein